ncbi:MAG TPA: hypothetical protein VGK73_03195 [Polyangiaceae bacterium]
MTELNDDARRVLRRGLALDGPDAERRARVKRRFLAAIGGGATALGGTASAAGAASTAAAGVAGAKSILTGSLLIWFGVGAAAGVGVSGAVAVSSRAAGPPVVVPAAPSAGEPTLLARGAGATPAVPVHAAENAVDSPSDAARPSAKAAAAQPEIASDPEPALPVAPPSANVATTLREEAALLQQAQRALAAGDPKRALALLAEHERMFPSGVLGEERAAARILALCASGDEDQARALARALTSASPSSLQIPRIRRSCAGSP